METILINLALNTLLTLLQITIPADGSSKKKWKKAILKVFKEIAKIYKDDPDFKTEAAKIS
jgi:hypothetical protein